MKRFPLLCAALLALSPAVFAQTPNTLTAEEQAAGWKLLFDGKAPAGLRGVKNPDFLKAGWTVVDGALVCAKDIKRAGKVTGGDIMTTEAFADFEFSFEWKVAVSGNSGVVYMTRAGLGGKATGCEYQIVDDTHHPDGLKGGPIKRTGSLYGILPPADDKKMNNPDQWNESRIVVQGNHVEHWLNGGKVLEYTLGSPELQKAVVASKARVPSGFGTKIKAPLVLLDEGEEIAFRSLKIRVLPPVAAVPR